MSYARVRKCALRTSHGETGDVVSMRNAPRLDSTGQRSCSFDLEPTSPLLECLQSLLQSHKYSLRLCPFTSAGNLTLVRNSLIIQHKSTFTGLRSFLGSLDPQLFLFSLHHLISASMRTPDSSVRSSVIPNSTICPAQISTTCWILSSPTHALHDFHFPDSLRFILIFSSRTSYTLIDYRYGYHRPSTHYLSPQKA